MKKSLFRLIDRVELLSCYILCFGFNIVFDYVKTLSIDSYLLEIFFKQFYDYRGLIIFLLTFAVVIFHYQMLNRKKVEVYCRVLVGDTIRSITIRYFLECLAILLIAFVISAIANVILGIGLTNNIYLSCVFVVYILISSLMVSRFENF
ncbi:putative membrane protein [[Clostridium] cellulosi]|uniref:Putative membrane protein n=1 Tax=[Clostridium] cellulosi TaxID=29343 RepID=A0A078KLV1_9FIRM|nr:putative membrane protein [[Clostridium] cellulosi]